MTSSFADRWKRGPPLASIESLLSFEAKSTPRSENNTIDGTTGGNSGEAIAGMFYFSFIDCCNKDLVGLKKW